MNTIQVSSFAAALFTVSANALAQGYTMQAVPTAAPAPIMEAPSAPSTLSHDSDHASVVGHFAVGYMGVSDVKLGQNLTKTSVGSTTLSAPVIGARYWQNEKMGFDVGLGLSMTGGSSSVKEGNTETTSDSAGAYAVVLHAGMPYVLAAKKHYSFQVIPEINFGYARQTVADATNSAKDVIYTGMRLDVGARAGAELQFGFIGVPQLALQGSVGLFYKYDHVGGSTENLAANVGTTALGTTVGNKPWDIFSGNVSALYYF